MGMELVNKEWKREQQTRPAFLRMDYHHQSSAATGCDYISILIVSFFHTSSLIKRKVGWQAKR